MVTKVQSFCSHAVKVFYVPDKHVIVTENGSMNRTEYLSQCSVSACDEDVNLYHYCVLYMYLQILCWRAVCLSESFNKK